MRPCCEVPENRELVEQSEDKRVERCKVCGAKHYELTIDPVVIAVEGTAL